MTEPWSVIQLSVEIKLSDYVSFSLCILARENGSIISAKRE